MRLSKFSNGVLGNPVDIVVNGACLFLLCLCVCVCVCVCVF
jgi:hypothetical protein